MSTIIVNGKFIMSSEPCIRHNDRGFTLGHGLFETIRVKNNLIPALDYHWKRLVSSAELIGLNVSFSIHELKSMLEELIEKNNLKHKLAGARLTLTHGEAERGIYPNFDPNPNYIISVFDYSPIQKKEFIVGIINVKKNEFSVCSRIKSLSYLENILAKREAIKLGLDEGILLNSVSNVADGTIFNIFMVKQGLIKTPKITDGALPGIVRSILLSNCPRELSIVEETINVKELMNADEIFLTNALVGIQPVTVFNNNSLDDFSIANQFYELLQEKNYI